jgi:hypothetical protein
MLSIHQGSCRQHGSSYRVTQTTATQVAAAGSTEAVQSVVAAVSAHMSTICYINSCTDYFLCHTTLSLPLHEHSTRFTVLRCILFLRTSACFFLCCCCCCCCQADVAVLVISSRKGEYETGFEKGGQTREHAQVGHAGAHRRSRQAADQACLAAGQAAQEELRGLAGRQLRICMLASPPSSSAADCSNAVMLHAVRGGAPAAARQCAGQAAA